MNDNAALHRSRHRILLNLAAPIAFFVSYHFTKDLTVGAWCQIGVAILSVAAGWLINRRVEPFPLLLAIVAGVMSALSLALNAPLILKLESSVPHFVIGLVLLGGVAIGAHPLAGLLPRFSLRPETWRRLSLICGGFALLMAIANTVVATTMPDRDWILFKFPIMPLLYVVLIVLLRPMILADLRRPPAA